jgi:hypothetical protein
MPKYEVQLTKTVIFNGVVEVTARTEEAARKKVYEMLDEGEVEFEEEDEDVEIDSVEEL